MIEKQIENKLTMAVKKNGGIALKLVCPSFAGMPDRLILLPDGHIGFCRAEGTRQKATPAPALKPQAAAGAWL
jgi:hypothetical protein